MNDIFKIEESEKVSPVEEASPAAERSENEVDPLALDEADGGEKNPLEAETREPGQEEVCDDDAKEVNISESKEQTELVVAKTPEPIQETLELESKDIVQEEIEEVKKIKDTPPVEESNTEEPVIEKSQSEVEKVQNESEFVAEKIEPICEPEPVPPEEVNEIKEPQPIVEEVKEIVVPEVPEPPKLPTPPPAQVVKAIEQTLEEPKPEVKEPKPLEQMPPPDVEMTDVSNSSQHKEQHKEVPRIEKEVKAPQPVNGDIIKDEQPIKRRASDEVETESPLKKLCQEVEKTFPQHDTMINDYIQTATKNNVDEIQRHTEQLLSEIQTLRELAQKKEHEWNNILHLKKVKEEILLRLLRRKQVISFEKSAEVNGSDRNDPFDYLNQAKNLAIDKSDEISGLSIKQPGSTMGPMMPQPPIMPVTSHFNPMTGLPPPYDKAAHLQQMPKPVFPQPMMMPGPMTGFPRDMNMNGQLATSFGLPMGRQGPTKDVKSIIADYRQRNPDITPRRGRRMRSILNPMMTPPRPIAPKMDNMNSLNNLNMLFNNLDMNQKAMLERLQQIQAGGLPNGLSFKDVLVQFANMQQSSAGLIPPRPMETINRPDHHIRPEGRRRQERNHEEAHQSTVKQSERLASSSPRLPPPPPYPEISLLPVTTSQESQQNSLLHGILTKQASPASQSYSPTLAKLLTSPERKQSAPTLPTFGQAKNCGEITITPVQPTPAPAPEPQPEKTEEVVQLDDEESAASSPSGAGSPMGSGGRLVIDEGGEGAEGAEAAGEPSGSGADEAGDAPLCQGCRRRDAQFVCAGCANQWYCSRDCQVAAWDEHSEMCSG